MQNILFIVFFIIILIILILVFKIRIYLFFIKAVKGKFSYEYVQFYKDHNIRSPFVPCLKDEILMKLIMFLDLNNRSQIFKTHLTIQFGNTKFLEPYHNIYKSKGKPICFNSLKENKIDFKVVGYRENFLEEGIKALYYFVNDKLIMGEYVFLDVSRSNSDNIIELLCKKYEIGLKVETETFYVDDDDNSQIYFENNGFDISIKYFYKKDRESIELLKNVQNNLKINKNKIQKSEYQKQLFDKL